MGLPHLHQTLVMNFKRAPIFEQAKFALFYAFFCHSVYFSVNFYTCEDDNNNNNNSI